MVEHKHSPKFCRKITFLMYVIVIASSRLKKFLQPKVIEFSGQDPKTFSFSLAREICSLLTQKTTPFVLKYSFSFTNNNLSLLYVGCLTFQRKFLTQMLTLWSEKWAVNHEWLSLIISLNILHILRPINILHYKISACSDPACPGEEKFYQILYFFYLPITQKLKRKNCSLWICFTQLKTAFPFFRTSINNECLLNTQD